MVFSIFKATSLATALLAAGTLAEPLTVIAPCPQTTPAPSNITVTAQYQTVSTCVPTTSCSASQCSSVYPYNTYAYVSSVIPCAYDGTSASSCTITKTDQAVPVSRSATTKSSVYPVTTGYKYSNSSTNATTSYTTSYLTISKEYVIPYNQIGPLGINGYGGSGLCKSCDTQEDGSRSQLSNVTECRSGSDKPQPQCVRYAETWISRPAPSSTSQTQAACSSKTSVAAAGTYVFTFPQTAPATTMVAPGQGGKSPSIVTVPPQPWFAYVTRTCHGPTVFDFTVTVTKTITWYMPYVTSSASKMTPVAAPTNGHSWNDWSAPTDPSSGSNAPITHWDDWLNDPQDNGNGHPKDNGNGQPDHGNYNGQPDHGNYNGPVDHWGDWYGSSSSATWTSSSTSYSSTTSGSSTNGQGPVIQTTSSSTSSSSSTLTSSGSSSNSQGPVTQTTSSSISSLSSSSSSSGSVSTSSVTSTGSPVSTATTSSTGSSSSSGSTSTLSTTSTSVSSTTTSSTSSVPTTFVISVRTAGQTLRKRALNYITFNGDNAVVSSDKTTAARFNLQNANLLVGTDFVGSAQTTGFSTLSKFASANNNVNGWSQNSDGTLTFANSLGFCQANDGGIYILLTTRPGFNCLDINLVVEDPNTPASTTTTVAGTSSSSSSSAAASSSSVSSSSAAASSSSSSSVAASSSSSSSSVAASSSSSSAAASSSSSLSSSAAAASSSSSSSAIASSSSSLSSSSAAASSSSSSSAAVSSSSSSSSAASSSSSSSSAAAATSTTSISSSSSSSSAAAATSTTSISSSSSSSSSAAASSSSVSSSSAAASSSSSSSAAASSSSVSSSSIAASSSSASSSSIAASSSSVSSSSIAASSSSVSSSSIAASSSSSSSVAASSSSSSSSAASSSSASSSSASSSSASSSSASSSSASSSSASSSSASSSSASSSSASSSSASSSSVAASSSSSSSSAASSSSVAASSSSSSSVGTSTTSGSTTTTTPADPPVNNPGGNPAPGNGKTFVIPINDGQGTKRFRKRAIRYIAFDNDGDGILVDNEDDAALFLLDAEGNLMSGGSYINIDTSSGSLAFEKTATKPTGGSKWAVDASGSLILSGAKGTCTKPDNTVFIVFDAYPPDCAPIALAAQVVANPSSSTPSSTISSTTSSSLTTIVTTQTTTVTTTTTGLTTFSTSFTPSMMTTRTTITTADPSADPDPVTTRVKRGLDARAHRRHARQNGVFHV